MSGIRAGDLTRVGARILCLAGLWILLASGCGRPVPAAPTATVTARPTVTLLPPPTNEVSVDFPIFHPTPTLIAPATDLFDNFASNTGGCVVVASFDRIPVRQVDPDLYNVPGVKFDFDRPRYSAGEPLRLSATAEVLGADDWHVVQVVSAQVLVEDPAARRSLFRLYDDGAHGDGKAGDGTFAFTLDDTHTPGIYKFLLQASVPVRSEEKPVLEDCFIAKTVYPGLSQAPAGSSCTSVAASDPVVVRSEGEGGNDTVDYGRAAFYPRAIATDSGMLATWVVGYDGLRPVPNAYVRTLDEDGHPTGSVQLLFDGNILGIPALFRAGDRIVLDYCGLFNGNQSRIASAFLDPSGSISSPQVRMPNNRDCNSAGPAAWTGRRMAFASANIGPSINDRAATLEVADKNGNSLEWKTIRTDAATFPQLAAGHDRLLMVISTDPGATLIHRFDPEGNESGAPVAIEPFPYEEGGSIRTGYFKYPAAVPTREGWLVVSTLWDGMGIYVTRLTVDGAVLSGPAAVDTDLDIPNGLDQVIPYRGGAAALGETMQGYVILFFAPDGRIVSRWLPEQDQQPFNGSLFTSGDRLFLIYGSPINETPPKTNQVRIRELKCGP